MILFILLLITTIFVQGTFAESYNPELDEIIVKYKKDITSQSKNFKESIQIIKLKKGEKLDDKIRYLKSLPNIIYAEPNYKIRKAENIQINDQYYQDQWGLNRIKVEKVWESCNGDESMIVAIIDSGIDLNHEDLGNRIWRNIGETDCSDGIDNDNNGYKDDCYGWNFVNGNSNVMDEDGHGTHIAGIIGAVTNNQIGIAGINWRVKLMPLKVLDSNGDGKLSDLGNAIYYAVNNGAKIINVSLGYPSTCQYVTKSSILEDAIKYAKERGVFIIASAGNYSCNNDLYPFYPASIDLGNMISVASSSKEDVLSSFSNYGIDSVHIAAPGEQIISTYKNNQYKFLTGTSMATPFVTGVFALLNSCGFNDKSLLKEILISYSVDPTEDFKSKILGGRLDLEKILSLKNQSLNNIKPIRPIIVKEPDIIQLNANTIKVKLSWKNKSVIANKFIIQRLEKNVFNSSYTNLAVVNDTYFEDIITIPSYSELIYSYRVAACSDENCLNVSDYSNEISISYNKSLQPVSSSGSGGCNVGYKSGLINLLVIIILFAFRKVYYSRIK